MDDDTAGYSECRGDTDYGEFLLLSYSVAVPLANQIAVCTGIHMHCSLGYIIDSVEPVKHTQKIS